jgi:hypothetical protein
VEACNEGAVSMDGPVDVAMYERSDLVQDGRPTTEVEVVRAPSRLYRLAVAGKERAHLEPEGFLRRRKQGLDR